MLCNPIRSGQFQITGNDPVDPPEDRQDRSQLFQIRLIITEDESRLYQGLNQEPADKH